MKILAIETSTEMCSVALLHGGSVSERSELAGQRHSECVLDMVSHILAEAKIDMRALDAVAFGEGPGSFTGLRIACGVAQGLALGSALPVIGVSTLMAMAEAEGHAKVMVATDARMGEIYHAAFIRDEAGWTIASPPCVREPDAAPAVVGDDWHACGNGFLIYRAALEHRYRGALKSLTADVMPTAVAVARLAERRFREGCFSGPDAAAPVYVRNKVALKASER